MKGATLHNNFYLTGPQTVGPKVTEGILSPEAQLNPLLKTKQVAKASSTTRSKCTCRTYTFCARSYNLKIISLEANLSSPDTLCCTMGRAVSTHGHAGQLPGGPTSIGAPF